MTPKISLVILLTVCHIVLVMFVWRIWYWIILYSLNLYFSLFSSLVCLILYWYHEEKFGLGHLWELKGWGFNQGWYCKEKVDASHSLGLKGFEWPPDISWVSCNVELFISLISLILNSLGYLWGISVTVTKKENKLSESLGIFCLGLSLLTSL